MKLRLAFVAVVALLVAIALAAPVAASGGSTGQKTMTGDLTRARTNAIQATCKRRWSASCAASVRLGGVPRACEDEDFELIVRAKRGRGRLLIYLDGALLTDDAAADVDCSALLPGEHRIEARCSFGRNPTLATKRFTVAR